MKTILFLSFLALSAPLAAQSPPLTLEEAVRQALAAHPALEAAQARERASEARRLQARSGYQPRVQFQEAFQIGDNPVYVFSSKLTQRQFNASDFLIDNLVSPDPYRNFQTQLNAEQTIWDGGATKNGLRAAEVGIKMTAEEKRRVEMEVVANVARAYFGIGLSEESLRVAREAVQAAEADLARANTLHNAGMATEADVLAVSVHLASLKEQEIRRASGLEVARAALNQAMGLGLDTPHTLTTPLTAAAAPASTAAQYESFAREQRPEVRLAGFAQTLAEVRGNEAKAALLPQVFVRGAFEADTKNFVTTGGANWLFVGGLRWNLFDGSRTKYARQEARDLAAGAAAEQRNAQSAVQLQARQSFADWRSAQERIAVTQSSIAMAEETLRIVRNRYSAGMANITEVLRAQTALLEAQTRRLIAVFDQRLAAVELERAAGTLKGNSDVLR
jgi:outer membrane protein